MPVIVGPHPEFHYQVVWVYSEAGTLLTAVGSEIRSDNHMRPVPRCVRAPTLGCFVLRLCNNVILSKKVTCQLAVVRNRGRQWILSWKVFERGENLSESHNYIYSIIITDGSTALCWALAVFVSKSYTQCVWLFSLEIRPSQSL